MTPDSQEILNHLDQYEEFMDQLEIIADMGSGKGEHSHWWATRTKEDKTPRRYTVVAIDDKVQVENRFRVNNVRQVRKDFSETGLQKNKVDLIWCYDTFQYATDPFGTLRHWWDIMREDAMLVIGLPQTTFIDDLARWQVYQPAGCYYSWNMVSLIHALAVSGFDCREGFLRQRRHDPMLWAAVYKSKHAPMDLAKTNWYDLMEKKLLPITADDCVMKIGFLRQEFLTVEWLDRQRYDLAVEMMP